MHLHIDEYAHLASPIHRWEPRAKFIALFGLIIAFSLVRDLRLVPIMLAITIGLFALSRLPLAFLVSRLRYPGMFLLVLAAVLVLFTGQTPLIQLGFITIRVEGVEYAALVVSRFAAILTVSLVLFGTSSFLVTVRTLRRMGIPALLADMLMLTVRYIFEFADTLTRMQRAMRLRGFDLTRLDRRSMTNLAGLIGSLLVRSYEQAERVYKAMRLRGYGAPMNGHNVMMDSASYSSAAAALEVVDLRFGYPDRPGVLQGITFSVGHGERVGVIGPNGAGKSSLFLSICGVLKQDAGTVRVYDQPVVPGKFHPSIGMVFQHSDDQLFSPSVRDDLAFGPANIGLNDADIEARVQEALALTNTAHLMDRPPHHLSGGEKRMVSIASVLTMRPRLVLYDEPDANLDMRARRRLIQFLQNAPHTLLMASHDLEMVLEVCSRVLVLDGGTIIADGDPRIIMADKLLMEAHGLEKPHSLMPHIHVDPAVNGGLPRHHDAAD